MQHTQSRYVGNVPPLDAFDNIRRRPPPAHQMPQGAGTVVPFEKKDDAEPKNASAKKTGKSKQKSSPQNEKRKRRTKSPAKRRRQRRIVAVLVALVLIAGGIWFTITVLFKIEKYDLQGASRYNVGEIAAVFGHAPGDNMYGFSVANAEERILQELPYIEEINIRRRLPSTIVFEVVQAVPTYSMPCEGGFAVLSAQMKVLEITQAAPENLTAIIGLSSVIVTQGQPLALDEQALQVLEGESSAGESLPAGTEDSSAVDEDSSVAEDSSSEVAPPAPVEEDGLQTTPRESFEALGEVLKALETAGFTDVNYVNVEDVLNLEFKWQNRATVLLGPRSNLQEKMNAAATLLNEEIEPDETGTLDMTYHTSTGKIYWNNS